VSPRGICTTYPTLPILSRVHASNTVAVVEHNMHVIAGSDWVIDTGSGAGEEGGRVVAAGPPAVVADAAKSRTAPYLARVLGD
jgi:excinuclease ABC subunit A